MSYPSVVQCLCAHGGIGKECSKPVALVTEYWGLTDEQIDEQDHPIHDHGFRWYDLDRTPFLCSDHYHDKTPIPNIYTPTTVRVAMKHERSTFLEQRFLTVPNDKWIYIMQLTDLEGRAISTFGYTIDSYSVMLGYDAKNLKTTPHSHLEQ